MEASRAASQQATWDFAEGHWARVADIPVTLEDAARGFVSRQEFTSENPLTLNLTNGVDTTMEQVKAFFAQYAEQAPIGEDNLTVTKLEEDGDVQIAHHHMKTPFPMSNRSMIVGYYKKDHDDGSFSFMVSSRGNEEMCEKYQSIIGKDVVGVLENIIHFTPGDEGKVTIKQCIIVDAGGSIPDMLKKKMLTRNQAVVDRLVEKIKAMK